MRNDKRASANELIVLKQEAFVRSIEYRVIDVLPVIKKFSRHCVHDEEVVSVQYNKWDDAKWSDIFQQETYDSSESKTNFKNRRNH